ncbi:MAG: hypothetical protein QXW60_03505 [Nitrososphaerota archaeon]
MLSPGLQQPLPLSSFSPSSPFPTPTVYVFGELLLCGEGGVAVAAFNEFLLAASRISLLEC